MTQYPLYQLICGLQCQLREHRRADIKLFDNPSLHGFRSTPDGEMKHSNATGNYFNKKQAQPITQEQENHFRELGYILLLRFSSMSLLVIVLILVYGEDISKTNHGGLTNKKEKPKEVYQYTNEQDPRRCFVRLYKLY